jgi:hypothetical protein
MKMASEVNQPVVTVSLMAFFLELFFFVRSRSFSSRSFGNTNGLTLSITLGKTGSLGLSSHE